MSHRTPFWTISSSFFLFPHSFPLSFPLEVPLPSDITSRLHHQSRPNFRWMSFVSRSWSQQQPGSVSVPRHPMLFYILKTQWQLCAFSGQTVGSGRKLKGRVQTHTCCFLASNIPLYFQKNLWKTGPNGWGCAVRNKITFAAEYKTGFNWILWLLVIYFDQEEKVHKTTYHFIQQYLDMDYGEER